MFSPSFPCGINFRSDPLPVRLVEEYAPAADVETEPPHVVDIIDNEILAFGHKADIIRSKIQAQDFNPRIKDNERRNYNEKYQM